MVLVNSRGYLIVKNRGSCYRNFWIGREQIGVMNIRLPEKYWGKRIRIKIEVDEGE